SHELKTPLTSLRLDLHLVLEEAVGPLTSKQTELLLDARDNAERLLAIVNNLLDLARLEQKPDRLDLRLEPPAELLNAAAEAIRPSNAPRSSTASFACRVRAAAAPGWGWPSSARSSRPTAARLPAPAIPAPAPSSASRCRSRRHPALSPAWTGRGAMTADPTR